MKRRVKIVGISFAGTCLLAVAAAQFFPDFVWNAYSWATRWTNAVVQRRDAPPSLPEPMPAMPYRDPEGYAVLSEWARGWAGTQSITVRAEVRRDPHIRWQEDANVLECIVPSRQRLEFEAAFASYRDLNTRDWTLEQRFTHPEQVVLVSTDRLKTAGEAPPSRYFAVSAVGFNPTRTRAIFYAEQHDGHWGAGDYFAFRKVNGKWIRAKVNGCGWIA